MNRRGVSFVLVCSASASALAVGACRPDIDDDASRIAGARIVGVRAEPAEARPNESVRLKALYTDGSRAILDAPLGWAFCTARRALSEPGPVGPVCLSGEAAEAIGSGASVAATVPRDACRVFGPDRPLGKPGEPGGRAADPDGTGGFFQPGLVGGPNAAPSLFELRVRCTLPSVPQQVSLDFEQRYRPNTNPELGSIARVHGDAVEPLLDGAELRARPGETIHLRAAWAECPEAAPCGGAERYVSYDVGDRTLVDRRESMTVSWLTTSGSFRMPRTGVGENDRTTSTDDEWMAPRTPGLGSLFIVLRGARGGSAFRAVSVRVE